LLGLLTYFSFAMPINRLPRELSSAHR